MNTLRTVKDIEKALAELGFVLARDKKHRVWKGPSGQTVVLPSSPSDSYRATKNIVSQFRRQGVVLKDG